MSSPQQTVYLVAGATRGVGFTLVKALSERSDVLIFAGARDPKKADALKALAAEKGNIEVVQLDVTSEADAQSAAKVVEEKAGRLDVLIANAGISEVSSYGPLLEQPIENYRQHVEVNTFGPIILTRAFNSLLSKSKNPKFLLVSTAGASFGLAFPMPMTPYMISKAAVNLFAIKAHQELTNLTFVALHPGIVNTDMGAAAVGFFGPFDGSISPETSAAGIIKLADTGTRETHGGQFWNYDGEVLPW